LREETLWRRIVENHPLKGAYVGSRECHVEPDWLLIYEAADDYLLLIRTGTHADLFSL
jgi:mRNA interferase YafQ